MLPNAPKIGLAVDCPWACRAAEQTWDNEDDLATNSSDIHKSGSGDKIGGEVNGGVSSIHFLYVLCLISQELALMHAPFSLAPQTLKP